MVVSLASTSADKTSTRRSEAASSSRGRSCSKATGLVLNYASSVAGGLRVEVQEPDGRPIDGYSLEQCAEVFGDEIERTVAWDRGSDLGSLAGRPVRLRFAMKEADLYSIQFSRNGRESRKSDTRSGPAARSYST